MESDYEEIGPPLSKLGGGSSHRAQAAVKPDMSLQAKAAAKVCDLCGTSAAIVRCRLCTDQVFCLACDDMYHRHPKRSSHPRKVRILAKYYHYFKV